MSIEFQFPCQNFRWEITPTDPPAPVERDGARDEFLARVANYYLRDAARLVRPRRDLDAPPTEDEYFVIRLLHETAGRP